MSQTKQVTLFLFFRRGAGSGKRPRAVRPEAEEWGQDEGVPAPGPVISVTLGCVSWGDIEYILVVSTWIIVEGRNLPFS